MGNHRTGNRFLRAVSSLIVGAATSDARGNLNHWRERILSGMLGAGAIFGIFAYIPSLVLAIQTRLWGVAFIDTVVYVAVVYLGQARRLDFRTRAIIFAALIYVLGVWLLIQVGPISQIYLFGFSILATLLLGSRAAVVSVSLNAVTLVTVGYLSEANLTSEFIAPFGPFGGWLVILANFLLVNVVLVVSIDILTRGLESTLVRERAAAAALAEERSQLIEANAQLSAQMEERERVEGELHRLAMAVEQAREVIVLIDPSGTPVYLNEAYERVLGRDRAEAMRRGGVLQFVEKTESQDGTKTFGIEALLDGPQGKERRLHVLRPTDEHTIQAQVTVSPITGPDGSGAGWVLILRDISAEAMLEHRLRQSQKLEAIGTLAGGIAHDFNNILTSILGNSEFLLQDLDESNPTREHAEEILVASERARDLVRQILLFSRRLEADRQPVRIDDIMSEVLRLLRPTLPSTIEIVYRNEAAGGVVLADPTGLHQIVMNLCTNAYHAMESSGGTLSIGASTIVADMPLAIRYPRLVQGDRYVRVSVEDTGGGIPPETLERIFDPFFTTKPQGKGTGLGLATVHGIVQQLGGEISVYSELGRGSAFSVYLPRFDQTTTLEDPAVEESSLPEGCGQRVLLVDDEEALLRLGERILLVAGYEVHTCGNGVEALERIEAAPSDWDLVITDLTMPRKTGIQLAEEVVGIRPDLPVILMSGFNESLTASDLESCGIRAFLNKPFTQQALGKAIRTALSAGHV